LEETQTGGTIPAGCFLSKAILAERGRRGCFHLHLRDDFLRELCGFLGGLCGQKLLTAKGAKKAREGR
jgi:hypothetical protein